MASAWDRRVANAAAAEDAAVAGADDAVRVRSGEVNGVPDDPVVRHDYR